MSTCEDELHLHCEWIKQELQGVEAANSELVQDNRLLRARARI
jgi:hypothetical protein